MRKSAADGLKGASRKVPAAQSDATRVTPKKVEAPSQTIGPRTSGRRVIAETAVRMASPVADAGASAMEAGSALRRGDMKGVAKGLAGAALALTGVGVVAGAARSISRARQVASNPVASRVMRGADNPSRAASRADRMNTANEARADASAIRASAAPQNATNRAAIRRKADDYSFYNQMSAPNNDLPQRLHNPGRIASDRAMRAEDIRLARRDANDANTRLQRELGFATSPKTTPYAQQLSTRRAVRKEGEAATARNKVTRKQADDALAHYTEETSGRAGRERVADSYNKPPLPKKKKQ